MLSLLQYFILIPLCSFVLSMLLPSKKEKLISGVAIASIFIHLIGLTTFVFYWIFNNIGVLDVKEIVLYKSTAFEFFIDYYFDKTLPKSYKHNSLTSESLGRLYPMTGS